MRKFIFIIFSVFFVFGCAGVQHDLVQKLVNREGNLPRYDFSPGTRVGIINTVGEQLTQNSIKAFSSENTFTKNYDIDWNIPEIMEQDIRSFLQQDGRYEVVLLPVPSSMQIYDIADLYREPNLKKVRSEIDSICEEKNIQVVVITGNHFYIHPDNSFVVRGYGLNTSQGASDTLAKVLGKAYAFTALGVQVYHSRPLTYIGGGRPGLAHPVSIPWPEDLHNIPNSSLESIKPLIVGDIKEIVTKALRKANLIAE